MISAHNLTEKGVHQPIESAPIFPTYPSKENQLLADIRQKYFKNFEKWQFDDMYQEMQRSKGSHRKLVTKSQYNKTEHQSLVLKKHSFRLKEVSNFQKEKTLQTRKLQNFMKLKYDVRDNLRVYGQVIGGAKQEQLVFSRQWSAVILLLSAFNTLQQTLPVSRKRYADWMHVYKHMWVFMNKVSQTVGELVALESQKRLEKSTKMGLTQEPQSTMMNVGSRAGRSKRMKRMTKETSLEHNNLHAIKSKVIESKTIPVNLLPNPGYWLTSVNNWTFNIIRSKTNATMLATIKHLFNHVAKSLKLKRQIDLKGSVCKLIRLQIHRVCKAIRQKQSAIQRSYEQCVFEDSSL